MYMKRPEEFARQALPYKEKIQKFIAARYRGAKGRERAKFIKSLHAPVNEKRQLASLYYAMSKKRPEAWKLKEDMAKYLINRYTQPWWRGEKSRRGTDALLQSYPYATNLARKNDAKLFAKYYSMRTHDPARYNLFAGILSRGVARYRGRKTRAQVQWELARADPVHLMRNRVSAEDYAKIKYRELHPELLAREIARRDAIRAAEYAAAQAAAQSTPIPDVEMQEVAVAPDSPIAPRVLFTDQFLAAAGFPNEEAFFQYVHSGTFTQQKLLYKTMHDTSLQAKDAGQMGSYREIRDLMRRVRTVMNETFRTRRKSNFPQTRAAVASSTGRTPTTLQTRAAVVSAIGRRYGSYMKSPIRRYIAALPSPIVQRYSQPTIRPRANYQTKPYRARKVRFARTAYFSRGYKRKRKRVRH
jgi:hypothetical protein